MLSQESSWTGTPGLGNLASVSLGHSKISAETISVISVPRISRCITENASGHETRFPVFRENPGF